jgi:HEAT repeat protein
VEAFPDRHRSTVRLGSTRGSHLEEARLYIDQLRTKEPHEAIPKLIEVLGDESWYLRERAAEVLVGFGPQAAPMAEELLRAGLWYSRAAALSVLGRIAAPTSLLPVMAFLRDPNRAIAEESARALFGYCHRGHAAAVAKILHARGPLERGNALGLLRQIDADGALRLERLIATPALMGPEGSLTPEEEEHIAQGITDEAWGISWDLLIAGAALPEWREDIVRHVRGDA